MAFGKGKKEKAPKPPKEKKEKKPKPPKKEKVKKPKKGKGDVPVEEQGQEEGQEKKFKPIFLLIPVVVVAALAAVVILVVLPRFKGNDADAEPTATVEPEPPELPEELVVGENSVIGMALEADESEAEAVLAKTITYTYINLNDAGKAAETYVGQLVRAETPFYMVDEDFVRTTDKPDYTAAEGSVIMARNLPLPETAEESEPPEESDDPDASEDPDNTPEPTPTPEPEPEPVRMVLSVRISWSEGKCVVTADEEEGMVTSPPPSSVPSSESVTMRGAQERLEAMSPAELGLPGETMDEYEVISMDGVAMVDGIACIRVHVYTEETEVQGSAFMGSYLMTIDGQHLYRVNPITDEVETLK